VGAAITTFAAIALGRLTMRSARDVEVSREAAIARRDTGVATPRRRRFLRRRDRVEEPETTQTA
jgi:hypothetical protein